MRAEEIFENYHDKVQNYILGKVQNLQVAEDLTSKVFLKICEKIDTFDETKASVSTWVYTIAGNQVIDYYRTKKNFVEIGEELSADTEDLSAGLLREELLSALADALETLPTREQDLIVLRYYHGKTLKEVADKLDMSYANCKIVHNKALSALKKSLQDFGK